jgi:cytochrome bd-type quinol oxidase subunit 1
VIAGLAWTYSSPTVISASALMTDIAALLIGLPLIAAAAGWLLAGREPHGIARQPLD